MYWHRGLLCNASCLFFFVMVGKWNKNGLFFFQLSNSGEESLVPVIEMNINSFFWDSLQFVYYVYKHNSAAIQLIFLGNYLEVDKYPFVIFLLPSAAIDSHLEYKPIIHKTINFELIYHNTSLRKRIRRTWKIR